MAQKKKPQVAQNGMTDEPINDIAKIINDTSFWQRERAETDEEILQRLEEYKNLCASKGIAPLIEDMCLYLGVSYRDVQSWRKGENCSSAVKQAIDNIFTWILSIDMKLVHSGKRQFVPHIWNSKQYHDQREPNSKLEDLLAGNLLRELPSSASIGQKYIAEFEESEADETEEMSEEK